MEKINPVVFLRASLGSVFIWFGIDKLVNTAYWYMWVPQYATPFFSQDLLRIFMVSLGIIEAALGVCIITGFYLRRASLFSAIILGATIVSLGILPVIRDIGFLGISIYLYLTSESQSGERVKIESRGKVVLAVVVIAVFMASLVFGTSGAPVPSEKERLAFVYPKEGSSLDNGQMEAVI
ncbi:MAG: DoxX family membrane protein, partial [Candidatus Aenigmarchaeota archaeon]|nr:DoxX family membrane protein [Candidatus Aenigmarchaeota archaeon]